MLIIISLAAAWIGAVSYEIKNGHKLHPDEPYLKGVDKGFKINN